MVPFLDLKRQYQPIRAEIDAAVARVFDDTDFILGKSVAAFEAAFAASCHSQHCVALNSGTSALHLALLAVGVQAGDEVITSPSTFVATVAAIDYIGARAVLVDIDPVSYTLDPALLEAAITPRTKAIVPVHLYGQTADLAPIMAIAKRHGLPVVEDAAQAHLALYQGKPAGSWGEIGCFSFYPGKNLGAAGEGGAIVTNDAELAATIRMYRDWGQSEKYHHKLKGFNYRMDGVQGAVLGVKLPHLAAWTQARQRHAAQYRALLQSLPGVQLPAEMAWGSPVYHVYAIQVAERDRVKQQLQERGVQTGIHYPIPVHLQPAYADLGYQRGDFPLAEALADRTLSLPMFAELTEDEVREVATALQQVVAG